jgi:hypothetical protein
MGNRWFKSIVIVVAAVISTALGDIWMQLGGWRKVAQEPIVAPVPIPWKMDCVSIPMDVSGVNDPHFVSAVESGIKDEDIVIGVVAFGESRAYLRSAFNFNGSPAPHIVNDKFGSIPVSITHCDRTRCTRVLTSDTQSSIKIRCGGWLDVQEMALIVGDKTYPQSSQEVPLQDLPFVVTTWKDWVAAQPKTQVYVGPPQEG